MKKSLFALTAILALGSSIFAYDKVGIDTTFGDDNRLEFDTYYNHYNEEGLVYGANASFNSWKVYGIKVKGMHLNGVAGWSISLPIGDLKSHLNALGGIQYTRFKVGSNSEDAFGLKAGVNYNIDITQELNTGVEIFYNHDFGSSNKGLDKGYMNYEAQASYEFAPNLYGKIKLGFSDQEIGGGGDSFYYGVGLGYKF